MKLQWLLMGSFMIFSMALKAQKPKPAKYFESILDHSVELKLDSIQIEKIKKIKEEFRLKIQEVRNAENPDREAHIKLREERKTQMEAVLTREQLAVWKSILQKKREESGMKKE